MSKYLEENQEYSVVSVFVNGKKNIYIVDKYKFPYMEIRELIFLEGFNKIKIKLEN